MTTDPWHRLARYVTDRRRKQLGLTRSQIQDAGGPSVATMGVIENARQDTYRDSILRKLEQVLGWETGSVDAILSGGEPTLVSRRPSGGIEAELQALVDNPHRSDRLREWARAQLVEIAAIRAANAAEAHARGEQAG